jgi:hypothetical protein
MMNLPEEFKELEDLMDKMPLKLQNGKPGLLATGGFADAVKVLLS